jgi:NADH-quinone oxidoreductase subunit C
VKDLDSIIAQVEERFGDAIEASERPLGDAVLTVGKARVRDVLSHLREEGFDLLLDIAGVDGLYLGRRDRFELVYNLYALEGDLRLRVKVFVPESDMRLPTMSDLWQSANWAEREAYDMFGFVFEGHPNLVRILCHREFVGHALRKDYPIMKGQWATGTSDLKPDLERE